MFFANNKRINFFSLFCILSFISSDASSSQERPRTGRIPGSTYDRWARESANELGAAIAPTAASPHEPFHEPLHETDPADGDPDVDLDAQDVLDQLGIPTDSDPAAYGEILRLGLARTGRRDYSTDASPAGTFVDEGLDRETTLKFSNDYSTKNKSRPSRTVTKHIVLHTTEAGDTSSLNTLRRYGLINYMVDSHGVVHRIIEHPRIAYHAGVSMWNGTSDVSRVTVGIEVVGRHNRQLAPAQELAVRHLVSKLQSIYGIADRDVLTHSMVAYGRPHKWCAYSHRGRKRCGMNMGTPDLRARIGLTDQPMIDPDVAAGRLYVADRALFRILFPTQEVHGRNMKGYKPLTIAAYDAANPGFSHGISGPAGNEPSHNSGSSAKPPKPGTPPKAKPKPDDVEIEYTAPDLDHNSHTKFGAFRIKKAKQSTWSLAGSEYAASTTIYFIPAKQVGRFYVRTGEQLQSTQPALLLDLPVGTQVLVGYIYAGKVSEIRRPEDIAPDRWNLNSTLYLTSSRKMKFIAGDDLENRKLPNGTLMFFRD